jgi:hypothetical protein
MAGVKSSMTKRINIVRGTPGAMVLQYRFHDHVVRNDNELFKIRQYIRNNPIHWERDGFNARYVNHVKEDHAGYEQEIWMI